MYYVEFEFDSSEIFFQVAANWIFSPLQCPFINQLNGDCAIVLKPSVGSFRDYVMGNDLHIGFSNSRSHVYSYCHRGVIKEGNVVILLEE